MFSHSKKFIFVHIPKVAGTSITGTETMKTSQISKYGEFELPKVDFNIDNLPFDPDKPNKFDPQPPHLRALDYVKYGYVTQSEFDGYFKFAFVRNPWARIVSEYKFRGHINRFSFKEFLFHHFPYPSWTDEYCHVIPQYDFLYDSDGKLLVDFVGKFENLQGDYDKICQKLDLPQETLPHSNKSMSLSQRNGGWIQMARNIKGILNGQKKANTFSHYTEYYDDESKEFVAKLYRHDIESFDYEFGK
jgi:hypothetical protein